MCVFRQTTPYSLIRKPQIGDFCKGFFKVFNRNRIDADWVQTGCRLEADWTCRLGADWKQTGKNLPTRASPRALLPPRQGIPRSTPSGALAIVQPGNQLNFSFCWQTFVPATYLNSVFCWKSFNPATNLTSVFVGSPSTWQRTYFRFLLAVVQPGN